MKNKAFIFDPITREFVGVALLDKDPLGGGWLIPANAVQAWTATITLQRAQVNSTEIQSGAISVGATSGGSAGPGAAWSASVVTIGPGVNSTARTAAESRPRNVAMHYIIKY